MCVAQVIVLSTSIFSVLLAFTSLYLFYRNKRRIFKTLDKRTDAAICVNLRSKGRNERDIREYMKNIGGYYDMDYPDE